MRYKIIVNLNLRRVYNYVGTKIYILLIKCFVKTTNLNTYKSKYPLSVLSSHLHVPVRLNQHNVYIPTSIHREREYLTIV